MRGVRLLPLIMLVFLGAPACERAVEMPAPGGPGPTFVGERPAARVLVVAETEGPGGAAAAQSARALATLLAHFGERCEIVSAEHYEGGLLNDYVCACYVAGKPDGEARDAFAADLERFDGRMVWVGAGVEALGAERAEELGIEADSEEVGSAAVEWTIWYGGQRHVERVSVPAVRASDDGVVLAEARRAGDRRAFIAGRGRVWYAAAGPELTEGRFWTACIWADALHEMLDRPHEGRRRLIVPVLRDVPVWATARQVPAVIGPMLEAGVPVGVLAATNWGDVALADRPEMVKGLRKAESMGAAVALVADTRLDAREHFRLAWEVGVHPVAWAGPADGGNPFRLRIAGPDVLPPFSAGGLLPGPIAISDAGYIAPKEAERLKMLEVVRDGVALVSFGLWAPPGPFQSFVRKREKEGWVSADLRELGVRVEDSRRMLVSGEAEVRVAAGVRLRQRVFGPGWRVEGEKVLTAESANPAELVVGLGRRRVAALEAVTEREPRPFIKGVTLDPFAYSGGSLSARDLAQMLAERYARNGINTVFFYAYNVDRGAAYRTRYRGASISEWGREDLLAHVLEACHARGLRVVAWLYSGRDKGMWKKHPEWRERTKDGRAHNPLRLHAAYFLCPRNPEVRRWYAGLLRDLARRYPTLDGIELCEPVVNWFGDQACYCEVCGSGFAEEHPGERTGGEAWRAFRAEGLTEFLSDCMRAVSEQGIDTYVMTIADAWSNGSILSSRRQAQESGLDLEAILDGPYAPDWVNFEIIWQQWAAIYGMEVFNYEWAVETARRLVRRTDGRARVVLHVELTDFGSQEMTPETMAETIERVWAAEPDGVECYHSAAIDRKAAWGVLKRAYGELP